MGERRRLYVKMDEILEAMDSHGDSPEFFLDLQTGEVELWIDPMITGEDPGIDREDDRFAEIPRVEPGEAYREMERFAAQLEEDDVRAALQRALEGKGAFRRFRETLAGFPDLRARWETEEQRWLLREALLWLEGLGIEAQYELRPIPPAPPLGRSEAPPGGARVGLFDLLLLGAPDGKTELLDGKVTRLFTAGSAEQARQVFCRVARELTEHQGLAWRNSLIEGSDRYQIGRHLLRREGRRVMLEVQVPSALWDAFAAG